jgi:hypothetical protein
MRVFRMMMMQHVEYVAYLGQETNVHKIKKKAWGK